MSIVPFGTLHEKLRNEPQNTKRRVSFEHISSFTYQVLHMNMRRVAAMASREVSIERPRWTRRENRKTATSTHTKKCQKMMNQSKLKKRSHL